MKIIVREAKREDLSALTQLSTQLGYPDPEGVVGARLEELIGEEDHLLLVADSHDGGVVGWVHAYIRKLLIHDPHIEVCGLVVDKHYRGQGIGEKLLDGIEAWAKGKGIGVVYLRSNIIRGEAHRFYEKVGYEIKKTSKIFWKYLS